MIESDLRSALESAPVPAPLAADAVRRRAVVVRRRRRAGAASATIGIVLVCLALVVQFLPDRQVSPGIPASGPATTVSGPRVPSGAASTGGTPTRGATSPYASETWDWSAALAAPLPAVSLRALAESDPRVLSSNVLDRRDRVGVSTCSRAVGITDGAQPWTTKAVYGTCDSPPFVDLSPLRVLPEGTSVSTLLAAALRGPTQAEVTAGFSSGDVAFPGTPIPLQVEVIGDVAVVDILVALPTTLTDYQAGSTLLWANLASATGLPKVSILVRHQVMCERWQGCGPGPSADARTPGTTITAPDRPALAVGAGPREVVDFYLAAAVLRDCEKANLAMGPGALPQLCSWQLTSYSVHGVATPTPTEAIFSMTLTGELDQSMFSGNQAHWFVTVKRQPDGTWRVTGQGTGP